MVRKLHIGGTFVSPGWEIMNAVPGPHVDHQGNAKDLTRFADCTFDEVYASHVLEHFDYNNELQVTLSEWYRVLKPFGRLYVSVPDLNVLAKLFLDKVRLTVEERFFVMRMIFGGHVDTHDYHFVGLNEEFLQDYLGAAGFANIRKVDTFGFFQDSSSAHYKDVMISLNLVAEKILSEMVNVNNQAISLDEACLVGIKHYQKKELGEAAKVFSQVVAADPNHPRALNALAVIDSENGNYEQAEAKLDKLLTAHPEFEKGYNTRGMLLQKLKKLEDAEKDFVKAISLNPGFAEAYGNLGNLNLALQKYPAAAECFRKVIGLNPRSPQALSSLGTVLSLQGKYDEAEASINAALDLDPHFAPAYLARGELFKLTDRPSEAIAAFEKAIVCQPDAMSLRYLGDYYCNVGKLSSALELLLKAQRLGESDPDTANVLGNIYVAMGRLDEALKAFRSVMDAGHGNRLLHANLVMTLHYSSKISSEDIFKESVALGTAYTAPPISTCLLVGDFPLKIGFVSADFKIHSVSYFLEPLLAALDRKKFKVYCYSGVRNPDAVTERFKSLADSWVDSFEMDDDLLAEKIVAEKIDILVDLSGYTRGNRLGVFARKPAPIQITWLGYPDTTGLRAIDYRISDAVADPIDVADKLHTERLIRLPDCFLCYQPPYDAPKVMPTPVHEKKYITFGSFNNLVKVTPEVLAVWSRIFNSVSSARLVLKCRTLIDDENHNYWLNLLEKHGIDTTRLLLIPYDISKMNHFARYGEIDIALDTFPYNGTTTTCEALWMGVPVITLAGDRHASRVGASLLSCVGLNELVANSHEEYVDMAIKLAADEARLLSYRQTMRNRILVSPLCDADGFARRWEDAVLKIVSEHDSH